MPSLVLCTARAALCSLLTRLGGGQGCLQVPGPPAAAARCPVGRSGPARPVVPSLRTTRQGWHPSFGPYPKCYAAFMADNLSQPPGKTSSCCSWRPSSLILSPCTSERSPALPALRLPLRAVTAVTPPLNQPASSHPALPTSVHPVCPVPVPEPALQVAFPALSGGAGPVPSPRWCSTRGCWPPLLRGCMLALGHFVVFPGVFLQRRSVVSLRRCGELSHPRCRTLLSLN